MRLRGSMKGLRRKSGRGFVVRRWLALRLGRCKGTSRTIVGGGNLSIIVRVSRRSFIVDQRQERAVRIRDVYILVKYEGRGGVGEWATGE
jgi:hypothetical protein